MSESRHICILSPGQPSTNPRLVKEADALADAGYQVSVVVGEFVDWARNTDRLFAGRPWRIVRQVPFGPKAPPWSRAVQVFRQRLARQLVKLGADHPSIVRAAWHPIAPDLVRAALLLRADLYIAHYPAALPAAALAAKRHRAKYAYDVEDFHLGDLPDRPEHKAERRMVRAIEGSYLQNCVYKTAAAPGIADAYVEAYGIQRPTVVLNVFPRAQSSPGPTLKGTATPGPSLYWFSQTIGPDRGLQCAVRAIARARSRPHLYVRGLPKDGFLNQLRNVAAELGVEKRFHVLPPAAPSKMAQLAASYDIGLIGEVGHTRSRKVGLTNKQFTYLSAGIPTVMTDIPAHRAIAPTLGDAAHLYRVEDAVDLAASLDGLLGDRETLAASRHAAWRLGQERFSWDVEKEVFLRCVRTVLRDVPQQGADAGTNSFKRAGRPNTDSGHQARDDRASKHANAVCVSP